MKAVVMAGGEGTRLRPLTSLLPKPMVPIVNQPVMEHILGLVKHHGITDVVATLAFMPQLIQDYFGAGDEWGMHIDYAIEETPLGTAGSVKNAENLLRGGEDEPFLVISGDALTDIDLSEAIRFHKNRGGAVTIALKRVDDPLEFGVVVTGADGRVERFLEKPTWGQVFSDTINTGIYVVEPWVLDYVPEATPYDFSADLFPALMAAGHALYGFVADGYWCDVGSRESYAQVHRDILDGLARIYVPGVQVSETLWVGEGSTVSPEAELGDKVVIGRNVTIRDGARIGDYTVIGDNSVVGADAKVTHSILWDDVFVGKQATVSGAVLCRRVDVRAGAQVDMGVVIGDESMVGRGAHVGVDVQVYPYKRIEPAAMVNTSLIWEAVGVRALFGQTGISGLVGIDITPEVALKVAEAFGSLLPKGGHVAVSRDTSAPARMIKRAIVAGLNAAGINTRDLRVASPALTRFTTQKTRCVGGVHVAVDPNDPQALSIQFYDKNGVDIAPWEEKKLERLYFRGEFRRAFFDDVGDITYPPRPLEYYTAAVIEGVESRVGIGEWRKVVVDFAGSSASIVLPLVAPGLKLNLVSLNAVVDSEVALEPVVESDAEITWEQLRRSVELFGADLGVRFDAGAERIRLLTSSGRVLDGDTALHAVVDLWGRSAGAGCAVAVPLQASLVVERIASRYGCEVLRPGRTRRSLATAVHEGRAGFAGSTRGGYIFADFLPAYDGVLAAGMIVRMLARERLTLDDVVDGLPPFFKVEHTVFCPSDRKGAVMRAVAEATSGLETDLTEGVRIEYEDGWALVLPDAIEPVVHVLAEGPSDQAAEARAAEWVRLVNETVAQDR